MNEDLTKAFAVFQEKLLSAKLIKMIKIFSYHYL